MTPTREIYWNIENHRLMYLILALALAICLYGFYRRYKAWRQGTRPEFSGSAARLRGVLRESLLQKRILRRLPSALMHLAIFWCFALSLFATAVISVQEHLGLNIFQGGFYLWLSLGLDLLGGLALLAVLYALARRCFFKPEQLDNQAADFIALALLLGIFLSGFAVEGLRIAGASDPWAAWSPLGHLFSLAWAGLPAEDVRPVFQALWWAHLLLGFTFIAYLPYGKLTHVLTAPVSQFLRDPEPPALPWLNLEDEQAERFGLGALSDYSFKDLLDTASCTRCGRCQAACPAWRTGKSLSPKRNVQLLKARLDSAPDMAGDEAAHAGLASEDIWACTSCGACEEQCPAFVRNAKLIAGRRRHLVLTEDSYPDAFRLLYRNLETNANPWGQGWAGRAAWSEGLDVPLLGESEAPERVEYLYWVGCAASFDARNQQTAKAFCALMRLAGLSYAILGAEEKCCGDPARRSGNEYLFQMHARENAGLFKSYGVKKIVTACPHCFNILANEYPQLGLELEVLHHSQLLSGLLQTGKLPTLHGGAGGSLLYHDPCYLGRYNGVYSAPRAVLRSIPGLGLVEMPECKAESFCCGGGGGHMWLEEEAGERINAYRAGQALANEAPALAVACPFCLTMLSDALKTLEADVPVSDVSELILKAIAGGDNENMRAR